MPAYPGYWYNDHAANGYADHLLHLLLDAKYHLPVSAGAIGIFMNEGGSVSITGATFNIIACSGECVLERKSPEQAQPTPTLEAEGQ